MNSYTVQPGDTLFRIAVRSGVSLQALMAANGTAFLIKGFGLSNSFREFNRMLAESKVHIVTSIRAQAIADLYLAINPENRSMNPISSLLDLKQAAERQCQAVPFDPNEKDFEAWRGIRRDRSVKQQPVAAAAMSWSGQCCLPLVQGFVAGLLYEQDLKSRKMDRLVG